MHESSRGGRGTKLPRTYAGHRHCQRRTPVITVAQRHHLLGSRITARRENCRLVRLRPAVRKETFGQLPFRRDARDAFRQRCLRLVGEHRRNMLQPAHLLDDLAVHRVVAVANADRDDAAEKIEILIAVRSPRTGLSHASPPVAPGSNETRSGKETADSPEGFPAWSCAPFHYGIRRVQVLKKTGRTVFSRRLSVDVLKRSDKITPLRDRCQAFEATSALRVLGGYVASEHISPESTRLRPAGAYQDYQVCSAACNAIFVKWFFHRIHSRETTFF